MDCGTCTLCCTLLPVSELDKPVSTACIHCHQGCSIYIDRPQICRDFKCTYNLSDKMDISLRPDNTHIVFEKVTEEIYIGTVDPNYLDAWKNKTVNKFIDKLNSKGISVIISSFTNEPKRFKVAKGHTPPEIYAKAMSILNSEINK